MGILDSIFGKSSSSLVNAWIRIEGPENIKQAKDESYNRKTIIFKHSTRCGISSRVLSQFEKEIAAQQPNVGLYYLDLLAYRDLSNSIATEFGITHQSPQILVLENGKIIHHASHSSISLNDFI